MLLYFRAEIFSYVYRSALFLKMIKKIIDLTMLKMSRSRQEK